MLTEVHEEERGAIVRELLRRCPSSLCRAVGIAAGALRSIPSVRSPNVAPPRRTTLESGSRTFLDRLNTEFRSVSFPRLRHTEKEYIFFFIKRETYIFGIVVLHGYDLGWFSAMMNAHNGRRSFVNNRCCDWRRSHRDEHQNRECRQHLFSVFSSPEPSNGGAFAAAEGDPACGVAERLTRKGWPLAANPWRALRKCNVRGRS